MRHSLIRHENIRIKYNDLFNNKYTINHIINPIVTNKCIPSHPHPQFTITTDGPITRGYVPSHVDI